jgi:hypothetical protein
VTLAARLEHDRILGLGDAGGLELVLGDAEGLEFVLGDVGGLESLVVGDLLRSVKIPAITAASTTPAAPITGPESPDLEEFPADVSVTSALS